jgi:hypothetical protein
MNYRAIVRSHWMSFLLLLPFLTMACVRKTLAITNAALVVRNQQDRNSQFFNLVMIAALYWGSAAFIAHAFWLEKRGRLWVLMKILLLAMFWMALPNLL